MQFAVLRKQHHANAFFFIRRSVADQEQRDSRLNKLINTIQSKGQDFLTAKLTPDTDSQCYYAYYDSPEELGRLVEDALAALLDALFPLGNDENEWVRESRAQQAFLQNLNDIYVPMANNEIITYFMNQMTERYMMISSDNKCFYGKSAFVANWLKEHQNDRTHNYIYHSIGAGFFGGNYKKIL